MPLTDITSKDFAVMQLQRGDTGSIIDIEEQSSIIVWLHISSDFVYIS